VLVGAGHHVGSVRVVAQGLEGPARRIHEPPQKAAVENVATRGAGSVVDVEGVVTVVVHDALHAFRDLVEGGFPRDLLVLALAALRGGNASHGALEAIG